MAITFAIFCFIPVFMITPSDATSYSDAAANITGNSTLGNSTLSASAGDDYYYYNYYQVLAQNSFSVEAAISTLIITLPSALDMFLDMIPSSVVSFIFMEDQRLNQSTATEKVVYHLSALEKILFIIGLTCFATLTFESVINYAYMSTLYSGFLNANTILTVCPILSFLSRCSSTWTPLRCIFISFLVCMACFVSMLVGVVTDVSTKTTLALVCNVIITISCGFYFLVCVFAFLNTFWFKQSGSDLTERKNSGEQRGDDIKAKSEQRFQDSVVAAHMTMNFFCLLQDTVWLWSFNSLNAKNIGIMTFCVVACATVVFVTETRVRKHAVAITMVS